MCQEFKISFNSKKSIFSMDQGKLLGHVISKYGFSINTERVEDISKLSIPSNIKKLQAFLDKINFIIRFMQYFVRIIQPITKLLKGNIPLKWMLEQVKGFE